MKSSKLLFCLMLGCTQVAHADGLVDRLVQFGASCFGILIPKEINSISPLLLSDTILFDLFRDFRFLPVLPPTMEVVKAKMSADEQAQLLQVYSHLINHIRTTEADMAIMKKLKTLGVRSDDDASIPLHYQLTAAERQRAEALSVPLIEGGRFWLRGSRNGHPEFVGYHRFQTPSGEFYLSLQPLHQPHTHVEVPGRESVPVTNFTPPITPEQILDMHEFIKQHAVVPTAIAQPRGVHYVGTQLRLLYEIITYDEEGKELKYHPTPEIIEQAKQVYAVGRFRNNSFSGDDLQTDYMRIRDRRIRIGVPVRVIDFNDEVRAGKALLLKSP